VGSLPAVTGGGRLATDVQAGKAHGCRISRSTTGLPKDKAFGEPGFFVSPQRPQRGVAAAKFENSKLKIRKK